MTALLSLTRWAIILLALGSVAAAAAPVVWHLMGESAVTPPPPPENAGREAPEPPEVDVLPILALAPFGKAPPPAPETTPVEETTLDLTLRGVILSNDPATSQAVIATTEGVHSFLPGDRVIEGARLVSVAADHVVLDLDGKRETLSFPEGERGDDPAPRRAGGLGALERAASAQQAEPGADDTPKTTDDYIDLWRKRIRANPQKVLDDIGLIATDRGYVIADQHDSGVRRAGLRAGDLVARVNGQQVGNVENDKTFFDEVAASDQARLEIIRDGKTIVMSFPLR